MTATTTSADELDYRKKHTVCDAMLWDYLQGKLDPAEALLVAAHYQLSAEARKRITELNSAAAVGLETLQPVAMKCSAQELFKKCRSAKAVPEDPCADKEASIPVPKPLQSYLGHCFGDVAWQTVVPGVQEKRVKMCGTKYAVRVMKLDKGASIPTHIHTGDEATVILHGAFTDGGETYQAGEVNYQKADSAVQHSPQAVSECICLVINEKHARFPGILGAFINPILRLRG